MIKPLDPIDNLRLQVAAALDPKRKSELGQFMTPFPVAKFMASLFPAPKGKPIRLLDPGSGIGSLTCAFLETLHGKGKEKHSVSVTAYEVDPLMARHLESNLANHQVKHACSTEIIRKDFIEEAVALILENKVGHFTHAILNPPYKKIHSSSRHRECLRSVDIETTNLYSAFTALSLLLLERGGQMVVIIPRSFCNGPYFKPFRTLLLQKAAIRRIHLFEARDRAFQSDDVLQENIILHLEKGATQGRVSVSTSTDGSFTDYQEEEYGFPEIVKPGDPERFIRIPSAKQKTSGGILGKFRALLPELGLGISTGPVVDFRLSDHLLKEPKAGAVPLLYPMHFSGNTMTWPKAHSKKPNAILMNEETQRWLYPNGHYVVTKRFSAKEEKRRIVASVVEPSFTKSQWLGFENHLNVFHQGKNPMPKTLAYGLAAFLNSTYVDDYFRSFNGHTQVNATDLRSLRYPSKTQLMALGTSVQGKEIEQTSLDRLLLDAA